MEYLSGRLLKPEDLTEPLAHEIGRCLATIHLNRLLGYGHPIQDKLTSDPRSYFTLKFKEGLEECKAQLPISLIQQCLDYDNVHLDLLTAVDGPCVVHRDFRPSNIIVHEGKLQGVIDWAGARASFTEEDLCTLERRAVNLSSKMSCSFWVSNSLLMNVPLGFKNSWLIPYKQHE